MNPNQRKRAILGIGSLAFLIILILGANTARFLPPLIPLLTLPILLITVILITKKLITQNPPNPELSISSRLRRTQIATCLLVAFFAPVILIVSIGATLHATILTFKTDDYLPVILSIGGLVILTPAFFTSFILAYPKRFYGPPREGLE